MEYQKIKGLIAAVFTPMHKDGSINLQPIREYGQYLSRNKLTGAFINGTTGEGIMMTTEERKIVAEQWITSVSDDFKMIIHIGSPCIESCKELAVHAKESGA